MKNQNLKGLFADELKDVYSAEKQILSLLPRFISLACTTELKDALSSHLKETENQVRRIEKIFSIVGIAPAENFCEGMGGLIKEANEITAETSKSHLLDAAIISAAQKIEHYEIASYGTLRSFAKQLDFNSEVISLLQETLDEEAAADKKLTKIADGSFFSSGINKQAFEEEATSPKARY